MGRASLRAGVQNNAVRTSFAPRSFIGAALPLLFLQLFAAEAFAQGTGAWRCAAPFGAALREGMTAPSYAGVPGLFEVPSATNLPDGEIAGAFNRAQLIDVPEPTLWQNNGFFSVNVLPRVTVVARGSVRHTGTDKDMFNRDESANAQWLVFDESGRRPALAVGMHDLSGANTLFSAKYATLSKSMAGRLRLTAGYGQGVRLLDGPFGGVELAPCRWITFIAEHDGRRSSTGVRISPFPSLADRLGVRPTLDAAWLGEQGFVGGVGVRIAAGPARQHRPLPARVETDKRLPSFGPAAGPVERAARSVRDALTTAGMENVRVLPVADGLLDVQYENRRWLLDELDGLGVALGIIAAHAPAEISRVRMTIRKLDIPVVVVTSRLTPWREYLADPARERAFAQQLQVEYPQRTQESLEGAPVNRSAFRLDVSARPRLETLLLSEISALETRVAVLPEFTAQLGRGLAVTGRRAIPVTQSRNFISELADPGADRLLVHAAAPLPRRFLPRGAQGIGQLSVGRLGHREVGAQWDQNVELRGGRWAVGVTGAAYGPTASSIEHSYAFGTLRWRRPQQELTASLSVGRFRYSDVGAVGDVSRRFGLAEVGFFLRATSLSSQAGMRVVVPLSPRKQLRPATIRVVLPDYFEHVEDVTVFEPYPAVRSDIARSLDTGFDVNRVYGGRGWLNEATIRSRAWAIRNAALRGR